MSLLSRKKSADAPRRRQAPQAGDARREAANRQAAATDAGNATFRRNRTLTGSLSSRVSSANEQQADLKSPRIHAHDLTKQRRKIGTTLGITLGVCLFLAIILYQFTARPVASAEDGSISLKNERYEKVLDEYLARHPVERFRFVLNESRLNEYLRRQLPEVVSVDPRGSAGFGASTFDVTIRKPLVSWMIGTSQYYVDANGVPFQTNYYDIPSVRIVDQSGVEQTSGTAIASSRFLNFVGRAVSLAEKSGIVVEQAIIPVNTTRQVELRVKDHDYPIKLSLDRSVGEQIEDMKRVITYFDANKVAIEYVDVRVPAKAFYKQK
ncbi:hypothetical protein HY312_04745 [Candidatus Saccharibacteria bacterium]|nr:hypothetical protein [Candidatus Saccharibacteria bacterium]